MAKRKIPPTPKSQKELSGKQHIPYDKARGNPNQEKGRGDQTSFKGDNVKPFSIGIKDIDESVLYYFENIIKPFVIQNGERLEVPTIYASPEIWKSQQKDGYYRDSKGKIMAPLIMVKKGTLEKNRAIGNKLDANNPYNFGIFQKRFSKKNTYDNFNVLNNRVPEKTYYASVIPDYINITYKCVIFTYYIEQLNKLIEAIEYASDSYWGDPERFKFVVRIDSFEENVEVQTGEGRIVKCEFNLKLYGHIIPDTIQKDLTFIKKFRDKSQTIFQLETTLTEDVEIGRERPTIFIGNPSPQYNITSSGTGSGICPNVTVLNSNNSYSQSVIAGGTLFIPNTYLSNSNGTYILSIPSTISASILDTYISNSNGTYFQNIPSGISSSIPDTYASNSDGTYQILIPSGFSGSIRNTYISNSNGTYTASIPSGVSSSLPDTYVSNSGQEFGSWNLVPSDYPIYDGFFYTAPNGLIIINGSDIVFRCINSNGYNWESYFSSYVGNILLNLNSLNGNILVSGSTSILAGAVVFGGSILESSGSFLDGDIVSIRINNGDYYQNYPSSYSGSFYDVAISVSNASSGTIEIVSYFPYGVVVSGAGSPEVNGIYIKSGSYNNSDRYYLLGSNPTQDYIHKNTTGDWEIAYGGAPYYYEPITSGVNYPWQVPSWSANLGALPTPNLRPKTVYNAFNAYVSNSNGTYILSIAPGISASIPDTYISNSDGGYTNSIASATSSSIENVRINVSGNTSFSIDFPYYPSSSQPVGTIYSTGSYGSGLVYNSGSSVSVSVLSGATGSFPNTYLSGSGGFYTASIGSGTSASIPNVAIRYTGGSVISYPYIASGSIITTISASMVTNSGSTVFVTISPAGSTGSFPNTYLSNSNGTYLLSIASGTSASIRNTYISNSNGTYTASISSGVSSSIPDAYISNSNGTYTASIPSAVSSSIPNTYLSNSGGTYIILAPSAATSSIRNTYISNSNGTYTASISSGITSSIPNTYLQNSGSLPTWTDSIASAVSYSLSQSVVRNPDGTNILVSYIPSSSGYIYDATTKKSGIIYETDMWSGETANSGSGSEGYNWSQGIYDQTHVPYPVNNAALSRSASNPFTILINNNTFGNTNRFTDLTGSQSYGGGLVIDHLSGWMWYRVSSSVTTWATAISAAEASTQGGYTDWHLPTERQLVQILNYSLYSNSPATTSLNYVPFNINSNLWSCTTHPGLSTSGRAYVVAGGAFAAQAKTNNISYILIRKHLSS